jgi:hypothetical protein
MVLVARAVGALVALAHLLILSSAPAEAGTFRLRVIDVVDQSGFERPMVAARIAIPYDWVAQSRVVWQIGNFCSALPVLIEVSAQSRDRRQGFNIYPTATWYWDNMASINRQFAAQMQAQMQMLGVPYVPMPEITAGAGSTPSGCLAATITDATGLLRRVGLGELRRGAVMLDGRSRIELVAPGSRQAVQRGPTGIETVSREDIGEMLIGFSLRGQDYVEIMRGYVAATQVTMPSVTGMGEPMVNGQGMGTIYAFHAPNGDLDFALFEVIVGSIAIDPRWLARVQSVMANNARVTQSEIAKRSAIISQSNNEINDIIVRGYEARSRSMDRSAENFSNYLRGQEVFVDRQSGEQVALPNTHRYNWRLNDGSYLLTDDANFNPNVELRIGGRRLEVRR